MLDKLSVEQIRELDKQITMLPIYKEYLELEIKIKPKKEDSDFSEKTIEAWASEIRRYQNIIMNIEYLKRNIR